MLSEQQVSCPYCGELIAILIDTYQESHHSVEDCSVCCRPIEIIVEIDAGEIARMDVFTGDESAY